MRGIALLQVLNRLLGLRREITPIGPMPLITLLLLINAGDSGQGEIYGLSLISILMKGY